MYMHENEASQETVQPHIYFSAKQAALYAILPGDPERVNRIAVHLDNVQKIAFNREYKSYAGFYKGVKMLVVSTGIGGTSTGIAVEELSKIGVKVMIRVGSCGALQPKIALGDLLLASGAVRDDGASRSYIDPAYPAIPDGIVLKTLLSLAPMYCKQFYTGIIRSHDSFYTDENEAIEAFWAKKRVLGSDSETAALFTIGTLRGVRTASILNTVVTAAGNLNQSVNAYTAGNSATADGERRAIQLALETIFTLNTTLFQPHRVQS